MKKIHLSGVALGILAAALAGCGDEDTTSTPQQTKSAITSRGFLVNGCQGTGVFDINSNNAISFVALDQSAFSDVSAKLFALDINNQEQLIAQSSKSDSVSEAMQSILNQVSNFTSAFEASVLLAAQNASTRNDAFSTNDVMSNNKATTTTVTAHARDAENRVITRSNSSGFNDTESWNDAHSRTNNGNRSFSFNAARSAANQEAEQGSRNRADSLAADFAAQAQNSRAHSAQSNEANSRANNKADSVAANFAAQAQNSRAHSSQESGNSSKAMNEANSRATNRAFNAASQFDVVAADMDNNGKKGFGFAGFGFGDIANTNFFATVGSQFNTVDSSLFNTQSASANNRAFANLRDSQFSSVFNISASQLANNSASHVFNDAIADTENSQFSTSFNIAASKLANNQESEQFAKTRADSFNLAVAADSNETFSELHNDNTTHNAFRNHNETDNTTIQKDKLATYDTATTANTAFARNSARSANGTDSSSFQKDATLAAQIARSDAQNKSLNEQKSKQFQAMTNLERFQTNSLVLRVNVTANSSAAILRVFTGNKAHNVAANQDFSQNFFGCGVTTGPAVVGKKGASILPSNALNTMDPAATTLGDHVAVKPGE